MPDSIYDFDFESITGERFKLDKYRGDVLLIVNTASK
jgi:glutathione peroxidase